MPSQLYMIVGSLNREVPYFQGARGTGIGVCAIDEDGQNARLIAEARDVDNPTFLSVDAASGMIYANSEVAEWREGVVSVYRFDANAGTFDYVNKQVTLGSVAAYNCIAADRKWLLVANYAEGFGGPDQSVSSFSISDDGSLSVATGSVKFEGTSIDAARQMRSHAHSVVQSIDEQYFVVADLGTDHLILLTRNGAGQLHEINRLAMPPGSGPRHTVFHPDGRWLYVTNELASTVATVAVDDGKLTLLGIESAVPAGADSHGADIHISSDGRFVYSSNRGHDSISVFSVGSDGRLSLIEQVLTGGRTPRNFALTPSGSHVFVANQNSDNIAVFSRDTDLGTLTDTGTRIAIGTPMCVRLVVF